VTAQLPGRDVELFAVAVADRATQGARSITSASSVKNSKRLRRARGGCDSADRVYRKVDALGNLDRVHQDPWARTSRLTEGLAGID